MEVTGSQREPLPVQFGMCVLKEKNSSWLFNGKCFFHSEKAPDCNISSFQKGTRDLMFKSGFKFLWGPKIFCCLYAHQSLTLFEKQESKGWGRERACYTSFWNGNT